MKMLWDCKCEKCSHQWVEYFDAEHSSPGTCPECGDARTHRMPGGLKNEKAKDPYDYLDKRPPDPKRIFSGPKVKSK